MLSVVRSVVGKVYITVQASLAVEVHRVMCSHELAILVTRLDWGGLESLDLALASGPTQPALH